MPKEIQFNNPAFRGVQAQQGTMYIPDEGEVFFFGGSNEKFGDRNFNSAVNYMKDGQLYSIDPMKAYYNSPAGKLEQFQTELNQLYGVNGPLGGNWSGAAMNSPSSLAIFKQQFENTVNNSQFLTPEQKQQIIAGGAAKEAAFKAGNGSVPPPYMRESNPFNDYLQSTGTKLIGQDGIALKEAGYQTIQKDLASKGIDVNLSQLALYNGADVLPRLGFTGNKSPAQGNIQDLYSSYLSRQQATGNIGAQTNIQGVGPGAATMDQAVAQGTATNYDASLGADKIAQLQAQDKTTQAQAGTAPTAYGTPVKLEPPQALKNAQGDTIFLSPSDASYQSYINAGYSATTPSQVPPGATYISDPKMLSGLTESQIWREPGTNRIYKLPTPLPSTASLASVTPGSTGGPITLTGASTGGTPPASTTPYDALNKFGGNLGATALNDIDKILMGFYQNQIGQTQGDLAKAKGEVDALKGEMTALKSSTYLEGRAKQLFESGRVEELFDALSSNRRRMENEMTSMNLGLQGLTDQPIAAEIIYGQKRTLQEQATARVGVIAASTEAMLGELDRAIQISDRVFSAIKEDRNTQIGALEKLLDLADKNKTNLLADEKDAIKAQIGVLSDANTRMEKDKAAMQKLITDQPLIASAAGISFTDTYDQALNKILTQAGNKNSEVYRLLQATSKTGGSKSGTGTGTGGTTTSRIFESYAKDIIDLEVALGGQAGSGAFDSVVDQALNDLEGAGIALNKEQVRQGIIREVNKQKGQATPQFTQEEINLAKGITPENDFWSSLGIGSDLSVTSPEQPSGNFLASPEEMAARADAFVKAGPTTTESIGMVKKLGNWIKDSFNKGGIIGQYIPKE